METERRTSQSKIEVRAADQVTLIQGYSALFSSPTIIWDFEEVIAPGAFKRALGESQDIRALFNHDANYVLGRTKNGTLILREDDTGLWMEAQPPRSPIADSIVENIKRGDVDGQSFAFTVRKQEWVFNDLDSDQLDRRIITEIGTMYDVGPVTYPAYASTSVKIKNEAKRIHEEARARWDSKRSVFQVPSGFELICREARGQSSNDERWEIEEELRQVTPEPVAEVKDDKPVEEAAPIETEKKPEEKTPEVPAGEELPSVPDQLGEGDIEAIHEASSREVSIKRKIGLTSRSTRQSLSA